MRFRFTDIVGTYRLQVSDELREFVERAFVDRAPPEARDVVRAEALHEAGGGEIEIHEDGTFVSRSHGQEFYRVTLAPDLDEHDDVTFAKPSGEPVRLRLVDPDTVEADQPGRPLARFGRIVRP
jgi:hypothetical protein